MSVQISGNDFIRSSICGEPMERCFGDNNHCLTENTLPFCQCGKRCLLRSGELIDVPVAGKHVAFTTQLEAQESIDNIFTVANVQFNEAHEEFGGWIVLGVRPMTLCECDGKMVMMLADLATVFLKYGQAVEACVRTYQLSVEKPYEYWFSNGKFRILAVKKAVEWV